MNKLLNVLHHLNNLCPNEFNLFSLNQLQIDSIEPIMNGMSVLLSAPTGCGKTEAVIIPLLEKILDNDLANGQRKTRVIYICPTKALINDLYNRFSWLKDRANIKFALKTGDNDIFYTGEIPQIVLTTPESLDVLLSTRIDVRSDRYIRVTESLSSVRTIVIDEIHQFVGNIRGEHLKWLIKRLSSINRKKLQIVGMSATIPDLSKINKYIEEAGSSPVLLSGGLNSRKLFFSLRTARTIDDLYEYVIKLRKNLKARKILIFANTRAECDKIYEQINKIAPEESCLVHYSTISQQEREDTEEQYKNSMTDMICVATSTLELGIDIGDIDAIILYGAPGNISSFVQKIGRGNRRKNDIFALGIIREYQDDVLNPDLLKFIGLLDLYFNNEFENVTNAMYYSVFIQQIFSIIKRYGLLPLKELIDLTIRLNYDNETVMKIINELVSKNIISKPTHHDDYAMSIWLESKIGRREIYGNMASGDHNKIRFINSSSKCIAEAPVKGNKDTIKSGNVVILGGKYYNIIDSKSKGFSFEVKVTESKSRTGAVCIKYSSMQVPASHKICQQSLKFDFNKFIKDVNLDESVKNQIEYIHYLSTKYDFSNHLHYKSQDGSYRYYTFAGTIGNYLISRTQKNIVEYDEIKIVLKQEIVNRKITVLEIKDIIENNIEDVSKIFGTSDFFSYLPFELKVEEILSRIEPELIAYLENFDKMEIKEIH